MDDVSAPPLIPSIPYDDPVAAIRWLTEVLGLRVIRTFEMPDGTIAHAELAWREAMVFVHARPPRANPWSVVGLASIALAAESAEVVDCGVSQKDHLGSPNDRQMRRVLLLDTRFRNDLNHPHRCRRGTRMLIDEVREIERVLALP